MAVDENGNQIIETVPESSRAEERITQLSDKVKVEATAREAAEKRATDAERKAAFSEGYAEMLVTNPAAKEFKADIEAKVLAGYSVEDATLATLAKAGKLGVPQAATPTAGEIAGGSASVTPPQVGGGQKPISEMSQAEKRAALDKELLLN